MTRAPSNFPSLIALLVAFLAHVSCTADGAPSVTLYVALDEEHSSRLVDLFTEETGTPVKARFDTEASKTVGLVSAIIEESSRPRCDVFWNNELAQTIRLGQKDLLAPYQSPSAATIPTRWKDADGHLWTGFAARARVLIVNTELMPDRAAWPTSMWDLTKPEHQGKCAVAKPLTGTTLTHFAALRHELGEAKVLEWIDKMDANGVEFLSSNGATMRAVAEGRKAFAFTDTDDFHVALKKGHPVACVFPDQGDGEVGTMLIPNSIAIVRGGPNPDGAKALVDWVLSERVEAMLAAAKSAQIPVRDGVQGPAEKQILSIDAFRTMVWDAKATASELEAATATFAKRFGG